MQFRYARHTNNLITITDFYTQIIGLEKLGSFENHSNYNGVFLGLKNADWHLEFTESDESANHHPDADDLLVLYVHSNEELNAIRKDAEKSGLRLAKSKNPYWQTNGIELKDPDGFGLIISVKQKELQSEDATTQLIKAKGIHTWEQFLSYVKNIPYGRNSDRTDFEWVVKENKGTCSSKHALTKQVADLNQMQGVQLIMGIYKMTQSNTEGIGNHLKENGLEYLPEAHCYLKVNGKRIDLTHPTSDIQKIQANIIEEKEIEPFQVGVYKVNFHKAFLRNWREQVGLSLSFDEVWEVRERYIGELAIA